MPRSGIVGPEVSRRKTPPALHVSPVVSLQPDLTLTQKSLPPFFARGRLRDAGLLGSMTGKRYTRFLAAPRACWWERFSEGDVCAEADHQFVPDLLRWITRVGDPRARIDEVLDVRLNLPRGQGLKLIGRLEKGLARADRRIDRRLEELHLSVEARRAAARPHGPHFDAEDIVVARRQRGVQREARIDAGADKVAIPVRREHRPDEHIETPIGVVLRTPDHLIHDPI